MNTICREEFEKAKTLIRVRKERMNYSVKPDVQNLDSGILFQFFENWEDVTKDYNGVKVDVKRRIFEVVNQKNIFDVIMYYADDFDIKNFELEYSMIYLNLDGSFDFIVDDVITHMKPFSVATFEKGTKLSISNFDNVNYLIGIQFESPLF